MARKPYILGNWKLHNTISESNSLAEAVKEKAAAFADKNVMIGVAPVYTSLYEVRKILGESSNVMLLAQNGYPKPKGAYTGEVSFHLLKDLGCDGVIVGHSERRHLLGESNALVAEKVESALQSGLKVILCLGETLEEREAGKTWEVIEEQLVTAMFHVPPSSRDQLIIAYEPVWAIGTGKTATPEQAEEVHKLIREKIKSSWLDEVAENMIILYGGSVKPSNAAELFAMENIDGALVGGASLDADSFMQIVEKALDS